MKKQLYEVKITFMNDETGEKETIIESHKANNAKSAEIAALENFEESYGSSAYDVEIISIRSV